jgi:hypothetical protein
MECEGERIWRERISRNREGERYGVSKSDRTMLHRTGTTQGREVDEKPVRRGEFVKAMTGKLAALSTLCVTV